MKRWARGNSRPSCAPNWPPIQTMPPRTKTGKGRQRRRKWLTEYGPTYDLSEDLRLRQFVRQRGGAWIQAAAVGVGLTGQPAGALTPNRVRAGCALSAPRCPSSL
jgi:hypothetical protein